MALWKDTNPAASPAPTLTPNPPTVNREPAHREPEKANVASLNPEAARRQQKERTDMKESVIAADLQIEGQIAGSGHVRIAGRFKGDVHVEGNLTIDQGAHLDGQVRASVVIVGGELQGNIENAKRVELLDGGIISGDVKAGSLTVSAGSRMRGQVEFGWEEGGRKPETKGFGTSS